MSKIYEALELAKRRLSSFRSPPDLSLPFESNMEEEMMELYQSIHISLDKGNSQLVEFIGSIPGEGASTIAREFAKTVALRFSKSVLLLDADHADPSQCRFFGIGEDNSLQKIVERDLSVDQACHRIPGSTLSVCRVAEESSFVPTFCESDKLDWIWTHFRENYGMVVVDSPPAGSSSAGFDLLRKVDKVILVVEAERTRWPVALNVEQRIVKNGGVIVGMVFNKRKFYIPMAIYKRL